MPLRLNEKQQRVEELAQLARTAQAAIALDYRGMDAGQMTNLRQTARRQGVYLKVVRNTLAKRALADTEYACLEEILTGPVLLALALRDPAEAARVIRQFVGDDQPLKVRGLALGRRLLPASDLARLADLPSASEAVARLMATLQAPVSRLVGTLTAPTAKLVRTLAALRDQKARAGT
jgi:large subunit ribosomal protein L10